MTLKISHQDKDRTIRLSELPVFEEATVALLKKTDAVKQNTILRDYDYDLPRTLQGRGESIKTVCAALNEIKEHETREVIYACLKTAFFCAMIAGIVLVAIFGGEFAAFFALGIVAYMMIAGYMSGPSAVRLLQFKEKSPWRTDYNAIYDVMMRGYAPAGLSFFAPFLPLYEVLKRQGRIERVQNKQNTEMQRDLTTFLRFAEELSKNLATIQQQLNEEKTKKEQYIAELKPKLQEPARKEATEAALITLEAELDMVQKTQTALKAFETLEMLAEPVV